MWLLVRDDKTPPALYANPSNTDVPDPLETDATVTELWDFDASTNFCAAPTQLASVAVTSKLVNSPVKQGKLAKLERVLGI